MNSHIAKFDDRKERTRSTAPRLAAVFALLFALVGCAGTASTSPPSALRTRSTNVTGATGEPADPLRLANGDFHVAYAAARAREQAALGGSRPYLVMGEGKLVLRYGGRLEERSLASARFDAIKHASHIPITAISAILAGEDSKALSEQAKRLRQAESAIAGVPLGDVESAARSVVRASIDLLEGAAAKTPAEADLHEFGLRTRRDTMQLLQAGCDESLLTLDAAVRQLRPMAGDAWPLAVVTITTDHQSRAEEVGVQYFERLFHEHAKEGALGEGRIVVIEGIGPNDGATQAMASHLYDQRLSALLFDEPTFLQGDVLGKHTESTLSRVLATPF